ncbi:hypothetical protein BC008_12250 [Mastigocoleus testarum BC008]|uniref:Uncharacterized protein n=1 Tax=Mastigocoleus testarum BC008 TaxID=371196 RepID=A0A0V7ZF00_9CYAN|nr:hypothetical protein BC008_12250 [Mastigocoleus testarum BC008]
MKPRASNPLFISTSGSVFGRSTKITRQQTSQKANKLTPQKPKQLIEKGFSILAEPPGKSLSLRSAKNKN